VVDWTLAGMNIDKVSRNDAGLVVVEGPRVATRYIPDQHQFERHPQKEERVRVSFPASDLPGVKAALATIFGIGIDPVVERASADYWRHYFFPATAWTGDDNVGPVIAVPGATAPAGVVMPVVTRKAEPEFTAEAQRDKVKGVVQVRVAVGLDGVPRQITIRQPLGYGLDAKAAEAVAKYRFTPGMKDGKPVVVEMFVNLTF
jgi:TonB family protein